jgi:hypothetical protein
MIVPRRSKARTQGARVILNADALEATEDASLAASSAAPTAQTMSRRALYLGRLEQGPELRDSLCAQLLALAACDRADHLAYQ